MPLSLAPWGNARPDPRHDRPANDASGLPDRVATDTVGDADAVAAMRTLKRISLRIGRFGDEATPPRFAARLGQARPWADRQPKAV